MNYVGRWVVIFSGKVHLSICGVIWLIAAAFQVYFHPMMFLGTLFPDTDTKKSLLGRYIPLWLFCKHRGATHTVWFLALCTWLVYYVMGTWPASSFAYGYLIHLVADEFSK